jgi:hypothetical protein
MAKRVRLAWCNHGRIYIETLSKSGELVGEPKDVTTEFWSVAVRSAMEHGMVEMNKDKAKCIEVKERNKRTGKRQAFRITVEKIAYEEDDEV